MVVQVVRRQIGGCIFKVDLVGFVDGLDGRVGEKDEDWRFGAEQLES